MGPTGCLGSPHFPSLYGRRKGKDVEIDGEDVINHDRGRDVDRWTPFVCLLMCSADEMTHQVFEVGCRASLCGADSLVATPAQPSCCGFDWVRSGCSVSAQVWLAILNVSTHIASAGCREPQ